MRRTTPSLGPQRQRTYQHISLALLAISIVYVVWANYVIFVGGNLPLTPISLGSGSTGAGLFMLAIGDLLVIGLLWLTVDALILNLVHMVLLKGDHGAPRRTSVPTGAATGAGLPAQGGWPAPPPPGPNPPSPAQPGYGRPSAGSTPYAPGGRAGTAVEDPNPWSEQYPTRQEPQRRSPNPPQYPDSRPPQGRQHPDQPPYPGEPRYPGEQLPPPR